MSKKPSHLYDGNTYKLVLWPEVQIYMSEDWFQSEACPAPYDYVQEAQAYFIPIENLTT